jgi:hypothetical protein
MVLDNPDANEFLYRERVPKAYLARFKDECVNTPCAVGVLGTASDSGTDPVIGSIPFSNEVVKPSFGSWSSIYEDAVLSVSFSDAGAGSVAVDLEYYIARLNDDRKEIIEWLSMGTNTGQVHGNFIKLENAGQVILVRIGNYTNPSASVSMELRLRGCTRRPK